MFPGHTQVNDPIVLMQREPRTQLWILRAHSSTSEGGGGG